MPDASPRKTEKPVKRSNKSASPATRRAAAGAREKKDATTPGAATASPPPTSNGSRLTVRKTYKLFIGGAFPRSESGRSYPVRSPGGDLLAYAAQGSRKDARDAVRAARSAFGGWSGATAYN